MPNRALHTAVGAVAGGTYAWYCARHRDDVNATVEVLGGAFGGYVGGKLPDICDPPWHPNHRGIGHGVLQAGMVISKAHRNLETWQEALRACARDYRRAAERSQAPEERVWHEFAAVMCDFAAGFIVGLPAGYASHLVLDALTSKGLPLVA